MLAKVLATFAGLLLVGVVPATAPITATIFGLSVAVALFDGNPTKIVDAVSAVLGRVVDFADEIGRLIGNASK